MIFKLKLKKPVSIGVPTRKDFQTLAERVEKLSKSVTALSGKKASIAKAKSKTAAKKPAGRASTKASTKRTS